MNLVRSSGGLARPASADASRKRRRSDHAACRAPSREQVRGSGATNEVSRTRRACRGDSRADDPCPSRPGVRPGSDPRQVYRSRCPPRSRSGRVPEEVSRRRCQTSRGRGVRRLVVGRPRSKCPVEVSGRSVRRLVVAAPGRGVRRLVMGRPPVEVSVRRCPGRGVRHLVVGRPGPRVPSRVGHPDREPGRGVRRLVVARPRSKCPVEVSGRGVRRLVVARPRSKCPVEVSGRGVPVEVSDIS